MSCCWNRASPSCRLLYIVVYQTRFNGVGMCIAQAARGRIRMCMRHDRMQALLPASMMHVGPWALVLPSSSKRKGAGKNTGFGRHLAISNVP